MRVSGAIAAMARAYPRRHRIELAAKGGKRMEEGGEAAPRRQGTKGAEKGGKGGLRAQNTGAKHGCPVPARKNTPRAAGDSPPRGRMGRGGEPSDAKAGEVPGGGSKTLST